MIVALVAIIQKYWKNSPFGMLLILALPTNTTYSFLKHESKLEFLSCRWYVRVSQHMLGQTGRGNYMVRGCELLWPMPSSLNWQYCILLSVQSTCEDKTHLHVVSFYFMQYLLLSMFSVSDFAGQDRLLHLTSDWAFQLVNDSLAFSRANSFCRGQFSSLATPDELEDQEAILELLQQTGLRPPIWVRDANKVASKPLALAKQCEWNPCTLS